MFHWLWAWLTGETDGDGGGEYAPSMFVWYPPGTGGGGGVGSH